MARDEGHRGRVAPVGERDPRIGGHGDRGGDPGDDLEGDTRLPEDLRLLASPAEDEGIASLEPRDDRPLLRLRHQEVVDLPLGNGMFAALLAGIDQTGLRTRMAEDLRADQVVVDDHLRLPDALHAPGG